MPALPTVPQAKFGWDGWCPYRDGDPAAPGHQSSCDPILSSWPLLDPFSFRDHRKPSRRPSTHRQQLLLCSSSREPSGCALPSPGNPASLPPAPPLCQLLPMAPQPGPQLSSLLSAILTLSLSLDVPRTSQLPSHLGLSSSSKPQFALSAGPCPQGASRGISQPPCSPATHYCSPAPHASPTHSLLSHLMATKVTQPPSLNPPTHPNVPSCDHLLASVPLSTMPPQRYF